MLTYGFYNSKNHDRRYDALQMSSIFDGIILDGVFMSIGNQFQVKQDANMTVLVDTGRAWFNHTWTLNDALLPIQVPQSEVVLDRIDALVLEVNSLVSVRANSIKIVKGTPSSNPVKPTLINNDDVHQHPLAYIRVNQRVTSIRQADITNAVGTSACPFVTGVLKGMNIDMLIAQWEDQWKAFFEKETEDMTSTNAYWKRMWESWYKNQMNWWIHFQKEYEEDMTKTGHYWKSRWEKWFYNYVNINSNDIDSWKHENQDAFTDWWNQIKGLMDADSDVAANLTSVIVDLQNEVQRLKDFHKDLAKEGIVYTHLEGDRPIFVAFTDENGDEIIDEGMDPIEGVIYEQEFITASDDTIIDVSKKVVFGVSDLSWRRYRA